MSDENETSPAVPAETSTATALKSMTTSHAHLKQKRARSQLSCTPCRQGKLKCNRQHPACDQCIKRSRETSCLYVPPPVKNKPAQNVKGRIRQLENLVVDLMTQSQQQKQVASRSSGDGERRLSNGDPSSAGSRASQPFSQPTPPSDNDTSPRYSEQSQQAPGNTDDVESATRPLGQMKISKDEISYVGESHWGAILNSISDLKRDIGEEEDEEEIQDSPEQSVNSWGSITSAGGQPHASTGLGFLLGDGNPAITREELLNSIPEKRVADRLLSLWFNSPDPFKPIIHAPTFQDEYKRFWRNPKDTPTMWLGLLYAILSLAASFGLRDNDPQSSSAQAILTDVNKYHTLSAGAAVLADFTKPKAYTLECLILYAAGLRSNNAFVNVWLMIGLVVRLALRMGYHRDPSRYQGISVFQGEMRRRVWSCIGMIDVLISFQLGLPSMFRTIVADTQSPRNLLDRDFNSSTAVLPPSRSADELTPSSYTRAKLRIVRVFADAAELSHQTIPASYEEVMRLDEELEEAKAAIPPLLQMPDISELVTDSAEQLMCRFNLDLLYLKTKIVIHRRYMLTPLNQLSPAEQKAGIGMSRHACIESALRVLNHHHTIYSASQNGGQLESVKWYMGSISTHDFLLAAMVICLELSEQVNDRSFPFGPMYMRCPKRGAMLDALEKSQRIWSEASHKKSSRDVPSIDGSEDRSGTAEHLFDDTEKASRAMSVMLDRVKRQIASSPDPGTVKDPLGLDAQMSNIPGTSHVHTDTDALTQRPFTGLVSMHDWNGMDGVPSAADSNVDWQTTNNLNTGQSQFDVSTAIESVPQTINSGSDQSLGQADFSMIGNMLDGPMNIDWEMWDNEIIKGPQADVNLDDWNELNLNGNFPDMGEQGIRVGNAMAGGTGLVSGHTSMSGGVAPMAIGSAMDFDFNSINGFDTNDRTGNSWWMSSPSEGISQGQG